MGRVEVTVLQQSDHPVALAICPQCDGEGGYTDYWGEYDACVLCAERGKLPAAEAWWWEQEIILLDLRIQRLAEGRPPSMLRGLFL